jgi:hypothetical protein
MKAPLGEVSIKLAEELGGAQVNLRTGGGMPSGTFAYIATSLDRERLGLAECHSAILELTARARRVLPDVGADGVGTG